MNVFGKNSIKKITVLLLLGMVFMGLLFLPIRIGKNANADIPIIGSMEQSAYTYCAKTANKVIVTYATAKLVDKIISTIQHTEIQFSPFGLGVTLAPGELLAAANDSIERLCTLLFSIAGVMLFAKLSIGMMSFACFKVLLPAAILFFFLGMFERFRRWARPLSGFLCQTALIIWIIFPLTSWVNNYVESAYLDKEYAVIDNELKSNSENIKQLEESIQKAGSAVVALSALQGNSTSSVNFPDAMPATWKFWGSDDEDASPSTKEQKKSSQSEKDDVPFYKKWANAGKAKIAEMATGLYNKVKEGFEKAVDIADDTVDKLYHLLVIFIITTIVLPLFLLFFFRGMFRATMKMF